MRKLNGFVTKSIVIFAVLVLASVGLIVGSAVKVILDKDETYPLSAGDLIYDNTYTQLELDQSALVKRSYNSDYSLETKDSVYALGDKTVSYTNADRAVEVYGGGYLLKDDGSATTLGKYYKTDSLNETSFIKMDDNKFVIVGPSISTNDGAINTKDYMFIVLDKAGNARLLNNDINVKVLGESVVNAGSLSLDLGSKSLNFAGNSLDLDTVSNYLSASGQLFEYTIKGGNGGTGGTGGSGGIGGKGGIGGSGGIGGIGGKGGSGGSGGTGGTGGTGASGQSTGINEELMILLSDLYIRRADTTANTVTVDYSFYDPFNYLGTAQFYIWETNNEKYASDPMESTDYQNLESLTGSNSENRLTFYDLKPNTSYTIVAGYINENAVFVEKDRITTLTESYHNAVVITDVYQTGYDYTLFLDSQYDYSNISVVYVFFEEDASGDIENLRYSDRGHKLEDHEILQAMNESGCGLVNDYGPGKEMSAQTHLAIRVIIVTKDNKKIDAAQLSAHNPFYGAASDKD